MHFKNHFLHLMIRPLRKKIIVQLIFYVALSEKSEKY